MILGRSESITTSTGHYEHVLHTANTTPLEPDVLENKFYAAGVGPVVKTISRRPGLGQSSSGSLISLGRPVTCRRAGTVPTHNRGRSEP